MADHLERAESRLLLHLHLADRREAVDLVDESRVGADGHVPAARGELLHPSHPDTIVVAPADLVGGGPVEVVRAVALRVGLEVGHHLRERVVGEPGLRARAREIAVRLVDGERRIPGDVVRDHRVDHRRETRRIRLTPEVPGPAEAVELVVVAVLRGKVLPAGDRGVGDAVPVLDRAHAEPHGVERLELLHLHVGGDRQVEPLCLLADRAPHVGAVDEDLEPLRALRLERAHLGPRLVRRVGGDDGVGDDRRRSDAVLGREPGVRDDRVDPLGGSRVANGGDAVRQHQLVHVVLRHRFARAREVDVRVHVDEAGHHVHPRGVDHAVERAGDLPRPFVGERGKLRRARFLDRRDRPVLDENVHRAAGGVPRPIDDHRVPDHEPGIALARGRRGRLRQERRGEDEREQGAKESHGGGR